METPINEQCGTSHGYLLATEIEGALLHRQADQLMGRSPMPAYRRSCDRLVGSGEYKFFHDRVVKVLDLIGDAS
jgi:hypothetical protein